MNQKWRARVRNGRPGHRAVWLGGVLVLGVILGTGCSKEDDSYDVLQLAGKVEELEVNPDGTGSITVLYYSERQQQDVLGTGEVTPETEIVINGVVGKLEDVRLGEQVRGEVRVEKDGDARRQIALKIYVDRAEPAAPSGDGSVGG